MWKDVLKRDWVKVRDDAKKEGIALSRIQARKIAFKEKHDPVFTKKFANSELVFMGRFLGFMMVLCIIGIIIAEIN